MSLTSPLKKLAPVLDWSHGAVWLVEKGLPEGGSIQRAMKILRRDISGDAVRVQRFREEIGMAARLGEVSRSLHILPAYEWDLAGTFVVMKYVPGDTLRTRIECSRCRL